MNPSRNRRWGVCKVWKTLATWKDSLKNMKQKELSLIMTLFSISWSPELLFDGRGAVDIC
jgi:hypothetical protein